MGRPPGRRNNKTLAREAEKATVNIGQPTMADPDVREEEITVSGQDAFGQKISETFRNKPKPEHVPPKKKLVTADFDHFDQMAAQEDDGGGFLYIPPDIIPDGMRYNWKTASVLGMPQARRLGRFEATGWSPVPAERHPGLFTPKGYVGHIEYDGLILMEKPEELCKRQEAREFMKARSQVLGKEAQIRGGDIDGVGFDTRGRGAKANKVSKSYEPFHVPED